MELQPKQLDKAIGMLIIFTEQGQWYHALCNGFAAAVKKKKQGRLADFGQRAIYAVHGYFLKVSVSTFTK